MNHRALFLLLAAACLALAGCAAKVVPTDVCKFQIPVAELTQGGDFDATEFFELAIETSKDYNFPPPMEYDRNADKLVFGHEEVSTMPGHKMVVYLWSPTAGSETGEYLCLNTMMLEARGEALTEGRASEIIDDYLDDLKARYAEKTNNTKQLLNRYNINPQGGKR